jgi:aminopeptidase N
MTDRAAALTVLAHHHYGSPEADEALAAFEERYASDLLAMDKWFQIQASVPGPQAVDTVRRLTTHPAFSIGNPNRLRSLVGTFSGANQTGFHRADGEGYRFFTETVLDVERRNPQMAARLATALRSWRSLEPGRQAHARDCLLAMANTENLSADLRDIVERTLA